MKINDLILEKKPFTINGINFRFSGANNECICFNGRSLIIGYKFGENLLDNNRDMTEDSINAFLLKFPAYSKNEYRVPNYSKTRNYNGERDNDGMCFGISVFTNKPVYESDFY